VPPTKEGRGVASHPKPEKRPLRSASAGVIRLAAGDWDFEEEQPTTQPATRSTLMDRLRIPGKLPGADAPPVTMPQIDPNDPDKTKKRRAIEELFPTLTELKSDFRTEPAPDLPQYTLADLEQIALSNNPKITQAAADVEAALGAAIQSGAYPNPTIGYEADTVGSGGTRNYQGMLF
jgi:hypothetical protein